MAAESPGPARDRSPAGNHPAASTTACELRPHSWAERRRGRQWRNPCSSVSVARLGRAAFPQGPPRWGEVSVTNLLGLRVPARPSWRLELLELAQAPGLRGPRSYACHPSGCGERRLLKGVTPGLRRLGHLHSASSCASSALSLSGPLVGLLFPFSPLCRPVLTRGVRRFSWERRCRL